MTKRNAKTSQAMKTDYRKRVVIPHDGDPAMRLYTSSGLLVAVGYVRVEFGGRGPYVEFAPDQVQKDNLRPISPIYYDTEGRQHKRKYYDEYRTNDAANVMVYLQRRDDVKYADYRVGMYYLSPFDLFTEEGAPVVVSLPHFCELKTIFPFVMEPDNYPEAHFLASGEECGKPAVGKITMGSAESGSHDYWLCAYHLFAIEHFWDTCDHGFAWFTCGTCCEDEQLVVR